MNTTESIKILSLFDQLDTEKKDKINKYIDNLLEYNKKINLVSRKMNKKSLTPLINETLFLQRFISRPVVIDAGSGNGLLGIPIALLNREKIVVLVETKKKKIAFLKELKDRMQLENVALFEGSISDYDKNMVHKNTSLVTRGFPRIDTLFKYLKKGNFHELIVITSRKKIIKIKKDMESREQKIYNIPFKDNLIIFKMENVSRETK